MISVIVYGYTAILSNGKEVRGQLSCSNPSEVIAHLNALEATPIDIYKKEDFMSAMFQSRPTVRDMSIFCRQIVSMLSAGVTILKCVEMLAEQSENKMLSTALSDCLVSIKSGSTLSEALAQHPKVFATLLVTMVESGEASGSLEMSFERMAVQYEKSAKLQKSMRKAVVYPAGVGIVTLISVAVLLGFVVPQFEQVLLEMDAEMPLLTIFVMAASDFFKQFWFVILIMIILTINGLRAFNATPQGKYLFDGMWLKWKFTKQLVMKSASAVLCRTMSTLLTSGVSIVEATEITSRVMSNIYYRDTLINIQKMMLADSDFATPLKDSNMFPPMLCNMVSIGAESGNMEMLLDTVATYYEADVEETIDTLMLSMEPMIIVLLAIIIGTVVTAVMLPMFSSLDAISSM